MAEKSFGVKEINLIGASGTPTIESPNNLNLNAVNVAISTNVSIGGTLSVTGNVSVGGTLTYEDVTNVDVVGVATFGDKVSIGSSLILTGANRLLIGNLAPSNEHISLRYVNNGSGLLDFNMNEETNYVRSMDILGLRSYKNVSTPNLGNGYGLDLDGDQIIPSHDFKPRFGLPNRRFGTVFATEGNYSGIVTASSFHLTNGTVVGGGGGSGISTISNFVNIADSLDVDGHTNLDNVSIAGITTFSDHIYAGRIYLGGSNGKYMQAGGNFELQMSGGVDMIFSVNTGGGTSGDIRLQRGSGTDSLVVNGSGGVNVTGTLSATTFSGSGANLTNLPAGQLSGSLPSISGANLTNLPSPDPSVSDVQVTFNISGNSSSGYTFTGPGNDGTTGNPDIYLIRGQRYRFNNTTGSGHPFEFRNADNNANYTDGITGSQSGIQDFNVQYDAPARLKYRCTIHTSSMVGDIYIVGAFPKISVSGQSDVVADNLADTLTLAAGSNVTLTTNASTDTITISASSGTNNYASSLSFNTSTGVLTVGRSGLSNLTVDLDGRYSTSDTNNYPSSLSFSTSTGVLTLGRSGLSNLTVDLDGRYLDSSSSLSSSNLSGTISNSILPTSIDIGTSGSIKAGNFQSSGQSNSLTNAGFHAYKSAGGFQGLSIVKDVGGSGNWGTALFIHRLSSAGTGNIAEFQYNNSFVGSISTNGSTTTYNPGSDYRLKQDVENISDGLGKIKSLRPVKFRWKNNPGLGTDSGFIAHEVQETGHFDHLVTGVKDGMREKSDDPNQLEPDYQGVDYSKFTPMLVAALKEISDKVDALDTRLTSLENT